jgi:hypothetical protein
MASSAARVHAQPFPVRVISRARVAGVRAALDVALGGELVDELRRGLPGDIQVLGQLSDGGTARGKPGKGEAVRGAQLVKSAFRPGL